MERLKHEQPPKETKELTHRTSGGREVPTHLQDGTGQDHHHKERIWTSTGGCMLEQEMTTEQDRSSMSREQLESALAQREDQLRRSQAKLEVMQGAEPILLSEIQEYKSALKEAKVALESALAGVWDGHYSGKGVVVEYAQAVDKEVKSALATINKVLE